MSSSTALEAAVAAIEEAAINLRPQFGEVDRIIALVAGDGLTIARCAIAFEDDDVFEIQVPSGVGMLQLLLAVAPGRLNRLKAAMH